MTRPAPVFSPAQTPTISVSRTWALHLLAFVLPLINLTFLLNGPYSWWQAIAWTGPIWLLVLADNGAPNDYRQPPADLPEWPFNVQLHLLVALQLVNHVALGVMASRIHVTSLATAGTAFANLVGMAVLSGTTAGYSGIVIAHELVHRRNRYEFFLGRLLLMFVCYEQFATEHVRGHHPRLGTPDDPATARFGEPLNDFVRRTIPGQFRSAWHLEKVRLGDADMRLTDPRMLRHRVLQGVVAEVLIVLGYLTVFGPVAMVFFLVQARASIALLETVNYIEHWGISRATRAVTPVDSWDTDNAFTLRTLVGLSRHADHHSQASRPYQKLRYFEQSPKMPHGYYGTILLAMFNNARYQELATAELRKKKLGPFREPAEISPEPALKAS